MTILVGLSLALSLIATPQDNIDIVKELYKEGRFSEAHAKLMTIPATKGNADVLLLYRGLLENEAEKSIKYFQKVSGGTVNHRSSGQFLSPQNSDEFTLQQRAYNTIAINASEVFDIAAQYRLFIGNDRKGLHGCSTQPRWSGLFEAPDPLPIFRPGSELESACNLAQKEAPPSGLIFFGQAGEGVTNGMAVCNFQNGFDLIDLQRDLRNKEQALNDGLQIIH